MMKPRLFWTMLLAFVLVILLGVCGMLGFFGLAVAGIWQPSDWRNNSALAHGDVETLSDYYLAHGNSWVGIDQRLDSTQFGGPMIMMGYALADTHGRVVASNDPNRKLGEQLAPDILARGTAIDADGKFAGTFVLLRPGRDFKPVPARPGGPPTAFWSVLRSFLLAGIALAGVLLALAAFFAQRISRPLQGISSAAHALAAGQLDVQAPGARVRELDELANSFNDMARALHQADLQRRQMTADIAHELRTPLSIIKGRLEGLQDGVYSATPEEIERLLGETALLERLIDDLRLLALAEAGQLPLYTEPLDPLDALQDAADAFAPQAAAQQVRLAVFPSEPLPPVEGDPQRLAQVFANLVANALRYTQAGGTITLSAKVEDSRSGIEDRGSSSDGPSSILDLRPSILFEVRDTGQGIAPDDLPHIFDRFYRADRSRTRGSGGAGLGLAIAKQIVLAHGGAIWAESTVGQGTAIRIALPIATTPAELAGAPTPYW
jgi:two-component system OmpR family sensor kinase/two-component system sensor histidine kinase BaeS